MKDNESRPTAVNELDFKVINTTGEKLEQNLENRSVEAFGGANVGKPQQAVSVPNKVSASFNLNVIKTTINSFCPSPFHIVLCFLYGLPFGHNVKKPLDVQKEGGVGI